MINQQLMNEVPMLRFLYYTMIDLMVVIGILGLLLIIGIAVSLIIDAIDAIKPSNKDGLGTSDERFEFRVRLADLEHDVDELKKRSVRK